MTIRISGLVTLLLLSIFFVAGSAAQAATITVDGTCTLSDAITAANTDGTTLGTCSGSFSGSFTPGGADTIELTVDVTLSTTVDSNREHRGRPREWPAQ